MRAYRSWPECRGEVQRCIALVFQRAGTARTSAAVGEKGNGVAAIRGIYLRDMAGRSKAKQQAPCTLTSAAQPQPPGTPDRDPDLLTASETDAYSGTFQASVQVEQFN